MLKTRARTLKWGAATAVLACVCTVAIAAPAAKLEQLQVAESGQVLSVSSRTPAHPRGVVVLVHGRTWSALPDFDFEPRQGNRSLLQLLAAAGYATYAVDLPGYGKSPRDPSGWLSPARSVRVVEATLQFARARHPALPPPILLGWSRGARVAALTATLAHQALSGLVLYAYTFDPGAPPAYGPPVNPAPAMPNTGELARSDFISPDVASPELIQDFVSVALASDPVRADVCCDEEFRAIQPEAIRVPTLLIQGDRDPGIKREVAAAFFARLASPQRRWVVIARGDHAAHIEDTAPEFASALLEFLGNGVGGPQQ
jgi:pimeloyl-ACP methyl ester carboxylesterase